MVEDIRGEMVFDVTVSYNTIPLPAFWVLR